MRYSVKEMHLTIQGEGYHAGRLAVFVRFTGCNVWSGKEATRDRDSQKGVCATWCDTDFVGNDGHLGGKYFATELCQQVRRLWPEEHGVPFVVFTGGEPSLQYDEELHAACVESRFYTAMETNGSRSLERACPNWVTVSPKPPMKVIAHEGVLVDEVKVVVPCVNPLEYSHVAKRRYVQPLDSLTPGLSASFVRDCTDFIKAHPEWRLSLQTHKIIGVP